MKQKGFLAVGNFDSDVGYAWRLMESFWVNIANQLKPLGYLPHICFASISKIPDCLLENGFLSHTVDFTKSDASNLIKQMSFIRKNDIEIVYFTDFKTLDIRYLLYRMAGVKKIIIHDHSPGVRTQPSPIKFKIKKALHKINLICADYCFAVSPYVEERMLTINGVAKNKVFCVTNGIPALEDPIRNNSRNDNKINIVTVARANYYKGIDFALNVIAKVIHINEGKSITYTLYGDGPNLEEFKDLTNKLNISNHVIFAGKVSGIPEKLIAADIAFHPSRGEAMSLAVLEYMRAELPVVASSNPSVSSFLTNNYDALIYDENSIESAAAALQQLIHSDEYRLQIGRNARDTVKNRFNDTLMYEKLNYYITKIVS